jgi:hypothetical protein
MVLAAAMKKAFRYLRKPPVPITFQEGKSRTMPAAPIREAEEILSK